MRFGWRIKTDAVSCFHSLSKIFNSVHWSLYLFALSEKKTYSLAGCLWGYFFQPSRRFTSIQKVSSVFLSAISDGSDAVQAIHQIFRMVGRRLKQKYPRNRKPILDGRLLHFFQPSEDGASMSFQNHW